MIIHIKEERLTKNRNQTRRTVLVILEHTLLQIEETEDYLKAVDVLKKRKENGLLLIQTELNMRMENAKSLAVFEEQRIQQFYEVMIDFVFHD